MTIKLAIPISILSPQDTENVIESNYLWVFPLVHSLRENSDFSVMGSHAIMVDQVRSGPLCLLEGDRV
jgi:hypothetical protein